MARPAPPVAPAMPGFARLPPERTERFVPIRFLYLYLHQAIKNELASLAEWLQRLEDGEDASALSGLLERYAFLQQIYKCHSSVEDEVCGGSGGCECVARGRPSRPRRVAFSRTRSSRREVTAREPPRLPGAWRARGVCQSTLRAKGRGISRVRSRIADVRLLTPPPFFLLSFAGRLPRFGSQGSQCDLCLLCGAR